MNVQRTFILLNSMLHDYRRNTKTTKSNAEILYYWFENNMFLFDPQQFNNGSMNPVNIYGYYQEIVQEMVNVLDDNHILENLVCDDDMCELIITDFRQLVQYNKMKVNPLLEGDQQDCPKGVVTNVHIESVPDEDDAADDDAATATAAAVEELFNQTREMCKNFLFPLLATISRSYKIFDFNDVINEKEDLLIVLLQIKQINVKHDNYYMFRNIMNKIIDTNEEIVNNIREIYLTAPPKKLRELVEKHFVPSIDEKKKNAEVPTPVILVDEMLDKVPTSFWTMPRKVFEPCCGKGNFVLGIFDRLYKGLEEMYPDEIERCNVIMTKCLYFADLTALNVFITTEIMKYHVQSYCGLDELNYKFNTYTGDTLQLNMKTTFGIDGFDMVCGNPPYNSSGNTSTGNTIWQCFTMKSLDEWLLPSGYLLFVHPPGWRKPNSAKGKFTRMFEQMTKQNQMVYLEIHGIKDGQKVFNCGTRYDWYLIQKVTPTTSTIVVDEDGNITHNDLSELTWLPNSNILDIAKLLAKEGDDRCPIMYDRTAYGADKKDRVSSNETSEFKYPCVHSTPKSGIRYMYSNVNDRGHFGVSKVIFGESGINNPVIDMEGKYGMTHGAMAIQVDSLDEANSISEVLQSEKFDKIIQSCIFSSFRIDWNIFKEFKKDFWSINL
jgi:hypothetical protein